MTLDLTKYLIFVDLSKYNDEVDFTELQNGHVEAVGIRINEDDGSLRKGKQ